MNIIAKSGAALLALGLVGFIPTPSHAKRVNVTGQAGAVEGDKGATLKAVKRDARRKAVEAGAGVLVKSNTIVRNYQMVSDEISSSSTGVITNEQFGKMTEKDGVASISLTADVSPSAVEDAICTVVKANHDPRIAVMFVETRKDGNESFSSVGSKSRGPLEALITEALMSNCFTLVDTGVKVTQLAGDGDIPSELVEAAITNANAQYLLVGTGNAERAQASDIVKGTGLNSYNVSASLKLMNVDTKELEATATASLSLTGIAFDGALMRHSRYGDKNDYGTPVKVTPKGNIYKTRELLQNRLMDQLFTAIGKRWASDLVNTSKVVVEVKNVKKFKHLKAFKRATTAVFSGAVIQNPKLRKGKATMVVEGIDGGADAFAEKLEGQKVAGMTVEVSEVSGGKVILELTK
jgi:hypothetical protein